MSPKNRRKDSFDLVGKDLRQHQFMWGDEELRKELLHYGFSKAEVVYAGAWAFDMRSEFPFQKNERYYGVKIPTWGSLPRSSFGTLNVFEIKSPAL